MSRFTVVYFVLYAILYAVFFAIQNYANLSLVLTKLGFRLSCSKCVGYIERSKNQTKCLDSIFGLVYSGILPTTASGDNFSSHELAAGDSGSLPFVLLYEDFVDWSVYHLVRVLLHVVLNILVNFDLNLTAAIFIYITTMFTYDALLNATEIKKDLKQLIGKYEEFAYRNRLRVHLKPKSLPVISRQNRVPTVFCLRDPAVANHQFKITTTNSLPCS